MMGCESLELGGLRVWGKAAVMHIDVYLIEPERVAARDAGISTLQVQAPAVLRSQRTCGCRWDADVKGRSTTW